MVKRVRKDSYELSKELSIEIVGLLAFTKYTAEQRLELAAAITPLIESVIRRVRNETL